MGISFSGAFRNIKGFVAKSPVFAAIMAYLIAESGDYFITEEGDPFISEE